jgi:hypothetical protein
MSFQISRSAAVRTKEMSPFLPDFPHGGAFRAVRMESSFDKEKAGTLFRPF